MRNICQGFPLWEEALDIEVSIGFIHIIMKGLSTVAFAAALFSKSTEGIQLHKRTDGPPRVVGMPIQRKDVPNPLLRDRIRRRNTVQVTLDNEVSNINESFSQY